MKIITAHDTQTLRYTVEELIKYVRMITKCEIMPEYEFVETLPAEQDGDTVVLGFLDELGLDTSDIIDTWVYRQGLLEFQFSLATAVGVFKGIIGMCLVLVSNKLVKKISDTTIL